jgi:fatty acid desaturase
MAKRKTKKQDRGHLIIQILIILGIIYLAGIILTALIPLVIILGLIYLVWRFWIKEK